MRVVFLPAAERDLGDLFLYIQDKLQNPIAARNIARKILQRTQMLTNFPELGSNLVNIDLGLDGYRYLLIDSYLVTYNVTDEEVCIVRILYARSDYVQLLQG
jgi:plasmid stabilization system protein ParE